MLSQVPEAVERAAEGRVRSDVRDSKKRTKGEKGVASEKLTRWRKRQGSGRETVHQAISDPRAQVGHLRKNTPDLISSKKRRRKRTGDASKLTLLGLGRRIERDRRPIRDDSEGDVRVPVRDDGSRFTLQIKGLEVSNGVTEEATRREGNGPRSPTPLSS